MHPCTLSSDAAGSSSAVKRGADERRSRGIRIDTSAPQIYRAFRKKPSPCSKRVLSLGSGKMGDGLLRNQPVRLRRTAAPAIYIFQWRATSFPYSGIKYRQSCHAEKKHGERGKKTRSTWDQGPGTRNKGQVIEI